MSLDITFPEPDVQAAAAADQPLARIRKRRKAQTARPVESRFDVPVHPAAAAFPELDATALKNLADDIAVNGQRHPILTWKGSIIDGRNRYLACALAHVTPVMEAKDDLTEEAVVSLIISQNILRRHLDRSQREVIAAKLVDVLPGNPDAACCGITREKAAALLHVSKPSVQRARQLLKADPVIAKQVEEGVTVDNRPMTVSKGLTMVKQRTSAAPEADVPQKLETEDTPISPTLAGELLTNLDMLELAVSKIVGTLAAMGSAHLTSAWKQYLRSHSSGDTSGRSGLRALITKMQANAVVSP